MAAKKNNHIIPKCLLKQWSTNENGREGIYVYEQERKEIYFSSAKGGGGFSFAAEPNFYVPKIDELRATNIEDWLAGVESTFASVIRKLSSRDANFLVRSEEEFHKLLLAVFSLNTRTKDGFLRVRKHLQENPSLKEDIEMAQNTSIDLVILENFINSTNELALEYANCEVHVFKSSEEKIIIGDEPFLPNFPEKDSNILPLGPDIFISIQKTKEAPFYYFHEEPFDKKNIEFLNGFIAKNSIHWIASNDKTTLEKYIPDFEKVKTKKVPEYREIQFLKNGWSFPHNPR
jgi:hypothetical protein